MRPKAFYFLFFFIAYCGLNACQRQGPTAPLESRGYFYEPAEVEEKKQSPTTKKVKTPSKKENHKQAAALPPTKKPTTHSTPKEKSLLDSLIERFWPSSSSPEKPASSSGLTRTQWPIKGKVIVPFSQATDGINIQAPMGTPIKPIAGGTVAHAGSMLIDYGHMVIVDHGNGWMSVYAHLEKPSLSKGVKVNTNTTLGRVGTSGKVQTPQLHFELRHHQKPVDPTKYLP